MVGKKNPSGVAAFLADFQSFIMRGNVLDLAVAVIIGGAFGKIIESFVTDIVTPLILNPALKAAQVDKLSELSLQGIKYGLFLAAILNFLVIAFSLFVLIQSIERTQKRMQRAQAIAEAEAPPAPTAEEKLTLAIEKLTTVLENNHPNA